MKFHAPLARKTNKLASQTFIHDHHVLEAYVICVLSIKDKQSIILRLEKGENENNLSAEYGISKQQISDIRLNKEKIMTEVCRQLRDQQSTEAKIDGSCT